MSHQSSNLFEYVRVTRHIIELKFRVTPMATSIASADWGLEPVEPEISPWPSHPFKQIDLRDHYNSLARVLHLYFDPSLLESGGLLSGGPKTLKLSVSGLRTTAGQALDSEEFEIVYDFDNTSVQDPFPSSRISDFSIEDHSIKRIRQALDTEEPPFQVEGSSPRSDSVFVEDMDISGTLSVEFSLAPIEDYITDKYIQVQKKNISKMFDRWTTIDVGLELDGKELKIHLPNLEEDEEAESRYLEDGYKYRVLLSKNIKAYI